MKNFSIKNNKGSAMLISVIYFMFISLAAVSGIASPVLKTYKDSNVNLNSKKAYYLSESGVEDAVYRIKTNKVIDTTEFIVLDGNTITTNIVDTGSQKTISSTGDVSGYERTTEVIVEAGIGVSFSYGVQSGQGGFLMANGSSVIGSVYSNGHITGSGSITGSATSANASALTTDQYNGSGVPAYDVQFGNTNATQDFAQSFRAGNTDVVNKVELYLKKVGTPSDITVRIVTDNSGSPDPTTTFASGTLSESLVSTSYGWVSVPLSTNPELTEGTTYWIVVDASTHASRYYFIGANADGYGTGVGKIGRYTSTWNNTNPRDLDGFFKLYLGGLKGLIDGITVGTAGIGNAYANTVNNSTIEGTNYCQIGFGNNKFCDNSLADPTQVSMPISDQNIEDWKDEAEVGGTYTGSLSISGSTSYGPKKITGDLTVSNGGDLTLTGTIWVQGNIDISNNANVRLDSSYGSSEGVIIADGTINVGNNGNFYGSGTSGSYIMVLSTASSSNAITLSNNAGAVMLYAAGGTVNVSNNAGATSINGKEISLGNNAVITFDSGLVNANFVSGPSGGWNINSWKETE